MSAAGRVLLAGLLPAGLLLTSVTGRAVGPLTRTPWGEVQWAGTAADYGRGGAGLALWDSTRLSVQNPALFHTGRRTRFQVGFSGTRSLVGADGREDTFSAGALDSWSLGFPLLWRDLHVGLGFAPLSQVDYLMAVAGTDDLGREQVLSLKGKGGLSRASLVLAGAPRPGLRAGVEAGLVFGSVLEEWKNFYPDAAPPYDSWVNTRHSLFGLQPRVGLQWQPRPGLACGLVWSPRVGADLRVDRENLGNDQDGELPLRQVKLPAAAALGLTWRRGGADWMLDLRLEDWRDVPMGSAAAQAQGLVERPLGVAAGVELPASGDFAAPWYRRATWRTGLRRQEWYARRQDQDGSWRDEETWTFSMGVGLPLRSRGSWLDLAAEAGRSGDAAMREDFLRLRLGLGAQDLWFHRPPR